MTVRLASRLFGGSVSVLAIAFAATPSFAQVADPATADAQTVPAPAGSGVASTTSGATSLDSATAGTAPGSASNTTGTSGASQDAGNPTPDPEREEIVVTGIRQSLANAQNIKRNSDTVVDAITAEDIGALPDRSVNEALQRVPGVSISRFAAPSDSAHYSAQGSGVVIRGLSYVRGEFNGRDAFAAGGGREIGFNDIPAEIVGSVEVFKNLTADLVEGGIAGTVNINTRKPFDSKKDLLFLSAGMNLGDLEKRGAPQFVGLVSKQFDLGSAGRFGILASGTYQKLYSRSDSVFISSMLPRYNDDKNGNGVQDAGEGRVLNAGTPFQSTLFDTFPLPAGRNVVYAPLGAGSRSQDFDRTRIGYSGAAQYETASGNLLVTAQFVRAESTDDWLEHTVEPNVYYGDANTVFPVGGSDFTYDDNGVFTSGTLGKRTGAVQGNGPNGYGVLSQFAPNGVFTTESNRHFFSKSISQDQSLNIKFEPIDRLHLNFDGQYATSKVKVRDDILDTATFSQTAIDLRGGIPQITSITPGFDTTSYFANPNSIYFRDAFNGRQDNDGHEWAFRGDAQFDVSDTAFLRNVRVGGRYADRKQLVRSADYNNWGYLSETWSAKGPVSYAALGQDEQSLHNFTNFFRGQTNTPPSATFVAEDILRDHDAFTDLLRKITTLGGGGYTALEDRKNGDGSPLNDGAYLNSELYRNREQTKSAYVRADFGVEDFGNGMSLTGNVGVRFVNTKDSSNGAITFPNQSSIFDASNLPATPTGGAYPQTLAGFCQSQRDKPPASGTINAICTVPATQQAAILAYANSGSIPDVARQKFNFWLPSANVKLQVTPTLLFRAAGSKAISRPNFGDLRNFVGVGVSSGNTAGNYQFSATSRNPYLRPVEALQFDLTSEWYFSKVGSLTATVFHKTLSNIIVDNLGYTRTLTNNGQTFDVQVNGPANVDGKSRIKGAEIAYQQTFDFLPGALSGLGMQANYTYVKAGKIPNPVPANGAADGSRPPQDVAGLYDNLPLQGLSKHTVNVAGFYDKGPFYARVAYSWRSKFLLTNRDCCFPFLPVYALPTGQLDASAFVTVNEHFKLGVTASNLLDETTKTNFLLNGAGLEAPRSFFKNDRSYTLSARMTF
ncbi:TonB-dependent receptor [Sphingomonas sp. CFBP 13728]|uniref:TonB-dependent receptor n=1 Tax=Sphingomonas sp. CFBP 13728 TaxID=2775294 RepID=UPI0017830511|nr:TonB-dependent receptor [Sphingomonas sp. CFBP 13728]